MLLGPDAVEPFLVDALNKTYDRSDIAMNVMFGLNTRVWTFRALQTESVYTMELLAPLDRPKHF